MQRPWAIKQVYWWRILIKVPAVSSDRFTTHGCTWLHLIHSSIQEMAIPKSLGLCNSNVLIAKMLKWLMPDGGSFLMVWCLSSDSKSKLKSYCIFKQSLQQPWTGKGAQQHGNTFPLWYRSLHFWDFIPMYVQSGGWELPMNHTNQHFRGELAIVWSWCSYAGELTGTIRVKKTFSKTIIKKKSCHYSAMSA